MNIPNFSQVETAADKRSRGLGYIIDMSDSLRQYRCGCIGLPLANI